MIVELDVSDRDTAARVVQIQRRAYALEAELMGFWGIPQLNETAGSVAARTDLIWRGAIADGVLVGVVAWESASDLIEIDRLAVDPASSRQGHGRRLVRAVPRGRPSLVSTGSANDPAKALYLSEGFEHIGETEVAPGIWTTQFRRKT